MKKLSKKQIGLTVQNARTSLRALNPAGLAEAVEVLLTDDNWREHLSPLDLRLHTWESFPEFVEKELETTGEALVKALRNYPRIAAEVANRLTRPHGNYTSAGSSSGRSRRLHAHSTPMKMRRLLQQRPDLAERVEAGELSLDAAWLEAGWKKRHVTAPADLDGFALYGVRKFGQDELLHAVQEAREETRECVICGTTYNPSAGRKQVTCGSDDCRKKRETQTHSTRYRARKKAEREARS